MRTGALAQLVRMHIAACGPALSGVGLAMTACTSGGSASEQGSGAQNWQETGDDGSPSLRVVDASYQLTWETAPSATPDVEWSVVSDLGYEVRLHRGWTTIYGMSLISCESAFVDRDPSAWAPAHRPVEPFELTKANSSADRLSPMPLGGHGGTEDPSADYGRQVEDLASLETIEYGTISIEATDYCALHFVYGPANSATPGLPAQVDIIGKSIYIDASWRAADAAAGDPWTEFSVEATHADGRIIDFAEAQFGSSNGPLVFRVQRDWRTLFDGVDFDLVSETQRDQLVLSNLVASAGLWIDGA